MLSAPSTSDRRRRADRRRTSLHALATPLAKAIDAGTIDILFQPQYRTRDDSLAGAEALVRWHHCMTGAVAGDTLFAIAAEAGLETALSRQVFVEAMRLAGEWPAHLSLSLNVTAADLADQAFVQRLGEALGETGFPPERLTLEITEQALVSDLDLSAAMLGAMVTMGVRVALDDFGAGFCNFSYLKALPLHAIKLDRSMVEGIARDERDLAVLRGIVAMAHALGLTVIAEGVENEAQRAVIAREGCAIWQGFLGAKPLAPADFAALAGS